ncbi:MAG: DUF2225 domain-containing protein [Candidatus Riflebacteria bacterium]|nr:DUF2225 domain-containing protein [Candidatus Riflebacteria bacterium]
MFPIGTLINGNYEIRALLGEGGMGAVFKAFDKKFSRTVALKFLHRDFSKDPAGIKRFLQEGEILASVRHPCIVEVYSLETDLVSQLPFLIMEYFAGKSLNAYQKEFPQGPLWIIKTFLSLLDGVKAFHAKNIIHRDLKPANILINSSGQLKIIDFGIAKGSRKQTQTGIAIGTPHNMSPEQCEGNPEITTKSDIYALGTVLWEMLVGGPPFDVQTGSSDPFLAIVLKHMNAPVPTEALSKTTHGPLFSNLLVRMLEKKPQNRPDLDFITQSLITLRDEHFAKSDQTLIRFSRDNKLLQGPFGKFQQSRDNLSGAPTLIQFLSEPLLWPEKFIQQRVIRLGKIHHPNVCGILEQGFDRNSALHFLAMEYADDTSFEKTKESLRKDRDALPKFMLKILEGLEAIHEQVEFHGNLNPSVIGFNKEGEPKISGFPMIPVPLLASKDDSKACSYIAPEQWKEGEKGSSAADVFSAGLIFWEILFGEFPSELRAGKQTTGGKSADSTEETVSMKPVSPKDPLFTFLEPLCQMVNINPAGRPPISKLLGLLRMIVRNSVFSLKKVEGNDGERCLILTRDNILATLVGVTLKEYGFGFQRAGSFNQISQMSLTEPIIAWFLDLDGIRKPVSEIIQNASKFAPDAKVVFFATNFTRELVESCLQLQATALLVKPLVVPRLVQTLSALKEEPELLDSESLFPLRFNLPEAENFQAGENRHHVLFFECCVCKERFGSVQAKPGAFEIYGTETDFCPICSEGNLPELYSVVVCPSCYYGNFTGRFQRAAFSESDKAAFMVSSKLERRSNIAQGLDFQGERGLEEALRSFDLAIMGVQELQQSEYDRHASEIFLKASWLCRRLNKPLEETGYQAQALECLMRIYRPYLSMGKQFSGLDAIKERLKPGLELMKERAVVVTGFLAAELSSRLSLDEEAEFYYEQIFGLPFLSRFTLLSRHVHKAFHEFKVRKASKGKATDQG